MKFTVVDYEKLVKIAGYKKCSDNSFMPSDETKKWYIIDNGSIMIYNIRAWKIWRPNLKVEQAMICLNRFYRWVLQTCNIKENKYFAEVWVKESMEEGNPELVFYQGYGKTIAEAICKAVLEK